VSEPPLACPKQGRCPGCALGDLPYPAGLAHKGKGLSQALRPYSELAPELLEPRAATPTQAYRLRAKLVCDKGALGLFERGSHRVIDVTDCKVLSASLTRASVALRRLLPLPIHGADLRETSDGVLLTLLTEEPRARAVLEAAAQKLVAEGAAASVALGVRRPGDVRLLGAEPELLLGPSTARHVIGESGTYAYAAHGGFVQAHAGQASYVYAEIARGLSQRLGSLAKAPLLELFAGNGSLALGLARAGARVTAVESYAPAIELAERAAREQGLQLEAVVADAAGFTRSNAARRFDAIIVNPPRRGLDAELRLAIGRAAPKALAYVSCNPRTLARDAWHLQRLGLALERAEPLDMIPWSDAIEALCWFAPAPAPPPRLLFEDASVVAVQKSAFESLVGGSGSLTERVRLLPGLSRAEPLERWGFAVSGVCWFARHAAAAAALGETLHAAERMLSLLVRGNLRKQGTIARTRAGTSGARYRKQAVVGRHSLVLATTHDADERGTLSDFASIRHPVLGDDETGDEASNHFAWHRHGLDRGFVHVSESTLPGAGNAGPRRARCDLDPDLAEVRASLGSD
jgi:23S rRNA (uracil1939-C5)-methyltransferase